MNRQVFPKFLSSNLKVMGFDVINLGSALLVGIILKRSFSLAPVYVLFGIVICFVLIESYQKLVPKDLFYRTFTSKKEVRFE